MSLSSLLAGGLILLTGSAIQGIAGFGMGLLAVPVLLMFFPNSIVTPLMVSLSTFTNAAILWQLKGRPDRSIVLPLLAGAVLGVYPGMMIPQIVPLQGFKIGVGVMVILAGILLMSGWTCQKGGKTSRMLVGFISGVFNGCISLSGPPVALFLTAENVERDRFRSSVAAYFLTLNVVSLVFFWRGGQITGAVGLALICYLPLMLAGTALGIRLGSRLAGKYFRWCVLCLVILSGLSLIGSSL